MVLEWKGDSKRADVRDSTQVVERMMERSVRIDPQRKQKDERGEKRQQMFSFDAQEMTFFRTREKEFLVRELEISKISCV